MNHNGERTFKDIVKHERTRRGWSQALLAEKISVSERAVNRWENGESRPKSFATQKLCEIFEKTPEELYLFREAGEEPDEALLQNAGQLPSLLTSNNASNGLQQQEEPADALLQGGSQPLLRTSNNASNGFQQQIATGASAPLQTDKNRQRMIERVQSIWIDGILKRSLHCAVLIAVGLYEQPDAVINPWRLLMQESEQPARPLPPDTHITQVYAAASGELLILGEPGAGKTTLLLELARDLLERAAQSETHPIPVIFNLSSWAIKRQPLVDWLVEELNSKYQVPLKLGKMWVNADAVLPLLDGLDEVASVHRQACIEALNAYRQAHGLLPMVVCSRSAEYLAQSDQVLLRTAVIIQPLTREQVNQYLTSIGIEMEAVRQAIDEDAVLQELATTPLMLSILTLAYRGRSIEDLPTAGDSVALRRHQIFERYVEYMLRRRGANKKYSLKRTKYWLAWLAKQMTQRNQTEFYIERMQLEWLPEGGKQSLLPAIFVGMAYGLCAALTIGFLIGLFYGSVFGLSAGVIMGLFNWFLYVGLNGPTAERISEQDVPPNPVEGGHWLWSRIPHQVSYLLRSQPAYGLTFALLNGSALGLILGLFSGLTFQLTTRLEEGFIHGLAIGAIIGFSGRLETEIRPAEIVNWSWAKMRRNIIKFVAGGILLGLVYGGIYQQVSRLVTGLIAGLAFGLMSGLSNDLLERQHLLKPNQGIQRSARNSVISALLAGLLGSLILLPIIEILYGPSYGLVYGIVSGIVLGLFIGLRNGGTACILHLTLRFLLWRDGSLPWNYAHFLDYAAERILLRKIGGGYIFIHRMLLDYFAELDTELDEYPQTVADLRDASRRKIIASSVTAVVFGGVPIASALARIDIIAALLTPGHLLRVYENHLAAVDSVSWSPDSRYLVSGSFDRTVQVWNAMSGDLIWLSRGHLDVVTSVAWSHNGRYIASGSNDGTVQVWDAKHGTHLLTAKGHTNNVHSVVWSSKDTYIASGSMDGTVRIWDAMSARCLFTYESPAGAVWGVTWSPDGRYIAFASGSTIQVLDVARKQQAWAYTKFAGPVRGVAWSPDGRSIASGSLDYAVRVWNVTDQHLAWTYQRQSGYFYNPSWSPDGKFISCGNQDAKIYILNTKKEREIAIYSNHTGTVYTVAWSPNGRYIASASSDTTVQVWQAP